jgi:hypothetical protein
LGNAAADAGSKAALKEAMTASKRNASHTSESVRISRNPRHTTARARSAATINRRRSIRSASTPATGESRKYMRSCTARTRATAMAEPVK